MRDTFVEAILQLVAKQELSEEHAYSLIKQYQVRLKTASSSAAHDGINRNRDIAIIGVAGRFPQADNKEQYWSNLVNGLNGIRTFPSSRLEQIRPFWMNRIKGHICRQAIWRKLIRLTRHF